MTNTTAYLLLGLIAWLAYASYVIRLVKKSGEYNVKQTNVQTMIALLVPIVGAGFVHFMYLAVRSKEPPEDRRSLRNDNELDGNLNRHHGNDGP